MTALRIAAEDVRMHENNPPKDGRLCSVVQRSFGLYNHRRYIRTGDDVRVAYRAQSSQWSLRELKSDLRSSFSQVYMCENEGCNTRNPMRTMHRVDFEVYR